MAKIGLRNIKTAISVLICLLIYVVIIYFAHFFNGSWSRSFKIATQLYTPFFACLATAYSVSTDKEKSLAQGKLRLTASVIGGLFGMLVVALYQLTGHDWPFQHISATGNPTTDASGFFQTGWLAGDSFTEADITSNFLGSFIIPIIITVFAVIFVIWFCNLIKRPQCSFIAVLTLTAVMTSLGTNPIIYGPNRILSTVIGILVALGVNLFRLPHYKNKNNLLIFGVDGIYSKENETFIGWNQYKINKLVLDGAKVTLYSTRTPVTLYNIMCSTKIKYPVICMSGAAIYDFNECKYTFLENIDNEIIPDLNNLLSSLNVCPIINAVRDDLLYTYIDKIDNEGKKIFAKNRKNARFISFNNTDKAPTKDLLYYLIIDTKEKIKEIKNNICNSELGNKLLVLEFEMYDSDIKTDYAYLKIYSREVEKLHALNQFKDKKTYSFARHKYDYILNNNVDWSITTDSVDEMLQKASKEIITDNKNHRVLLKKANKIYHTKEN